MKIASFNLLAQVWIDDDLRQRVSDKRHLSRAYRIKRQIEVLKKLDADIVFLQEATPIVLRAFQRALPQYHVPPCFVPIDWQPTRRKRETRKRLVAINGNAIIWKHDVFAGPVTCAKVLLDQERGVYAAKVNGHLKKLGVDATLLCVHFDYGHRDNVKRQTRQFRSIFRNQHILDQMKHVIIAGDFNMGGTNLGRLPELSNENLIDVCSNIRTHAFPEPDEKNVTHILLRGFKQSSKTKVGGAKSVADCLKFLGSDHFPVSVRVKE